MYETISIHGARLHNLKNIDLEIPKNKLVVLTGLSGSGKSTLGFDILNKEGIRQFMESLGFITMGMSKPPVDSISGLSPSISINQHLSNHSPRSTVGTSTEVYTYLRVLFARLGHRPCLHCSKDIPPSFDLSDTDWDTDENGDEDRVNPEATIPCPHCGFKITELSMAHFSFNKPEGACPTCTGLGTVHQANIKKLVDESKSIQDGAVLLWDKNYINYYSGTIQAASDYYGLDLDQTIPVKNFSESQYDLLLFGVNDPRFQAHFPDKEPPTAANKGRFEGIATNVLRRYAERIQDVEYREKMEELLIKQTCPDCQGTRINPESRTVTVNGKTIVQLSQIPLVDLGIWINDLPEVLTPDEQSIASSILTDLRERIHRLVESYKSHLITLIDFCAAKKETEMTLSDFTTTRLEEKEMLELLDEFDD